MPLPNGISGTPSNGDGLICSDAASRKPVAAEGELEEVRRDMASPGVPISRATVTRNQCASGLQGDKSGSKGDRKRGLTGLRLGIKPYPRQV
jgi:hypothetical protein